MKTRFVKTQGKEVPFKSNFFDFIISSQVVEHLTNDEIFYITLKKEEF